VKQPFVSGRADSAIIVQEIESPFLFQLHLPSYRAYTLRVRRGGKVQANSLRCGAVDLADISTVWSGASTRGQIAELQPQNRGAYAARMTIVLPAILGCCTLGPIRGTG
jgi:hypothetical protein